MSKSQFKFMVSKLRDFPECNIKIRYLVDINSLFENIFEKESLSGLELSTVVCLLSFIFKGKSKDSISYVNKDFIKDMRKLDAHSQEGLIYKTDIVSENSEIIIKVNKNSKMYRNLYLEYFVGVMAINNLRYKIPTFVGTLGALISPRKMLLASHRGEKLFVMYEKVEGKDLSSMLSDNEISFEEYIIIFFQILLSLEVAQRECKFTHFDLHPGNVMIKRIVRYEYEVCLDENIFVINTDLLPVIIDFGFTTVVVDDRTIGRSNFEVYGMMDYMVQGYDMYKFLIYSARYAESKLKKQIYDLFMFYGSDDYYNIVVREKEGIKEAVKEYCRYGTYSKLATYTPMMFIRWLYDNIEYEEYIRKYVVSNDRDSLYCLESRKNRVNIFSNVGEKVSLDYIKNNILTTNSYLLSVYSLKMLNKNYYTEINSDILNEYKERMVEADLSVIYNYREIGVISLYEMNRVIKSILNVPISGVTDVLKREKIEEIRRLRFYEEIKPYLNVLYMVRELGLDEYDEWKRDFMSSEVYVLSVQNMDKLDRVFRWSETILESIK